LIRSLPVSFSLGLSVHVAASPAAPFSTPLGLTFRFNVDFAVVSITSHDD
jgi:hypothetical protein